MAQEMKFRPDEIKIPWLGLPADRPCVRLYRDCRGFRGRLRQLGDFDWDGHPSGVTHVFP